MIGERLYVMPDKFDVDDNYKNRLEEIWTGNAYYQDAEKWMEIQWHDIVWPKISDFDFTNVVDLACGQGRNSTKLVNICKKLTLVDICQSNIDFCKNRFKDKSNIYFKKCDGDSLPIDDNSVTLMYCFDAMVHFDPEIIYNYLFDIFRVLKPGCHAFLHHSNYSLWCNVDWRYNPHARNYMTKHLFSLWARKAGFEIVSQDVIPWGEKEQETYVESLDCISVLRKPEKCQE